MTEFPPFTVPHHAHSGRPLGPRSSRFPKFTAWRIGLGWSCDELAAHLTRRASSVLERELRTSGRLVRYWENGLRVPDEDRLTILTVLALESGALSDEQALAAWFDLALEQRGA